MLDGEVYIACRSGKKGEKAIASLRVQTEKEAHFLQLDLVSLVSIREAAQKFLESEPKLHILFNNAGVMAPSIDLRTADGYDLTIGINVLAKDRITSQVSYSPHLVVVADEAPHEARIVNTSSIASEMPPKNLDYAAFKENDKKRALGPASLYSTSKWMNIVYTAEFSRRYKNKGIVSSAVNPGLIQSELQRHLIGFRAWATSKILHPLPYGALTQLYAGTSEHGDEFDGAYFVPWARKGTPNPTSQGSAEGKKLWEWLEAQVKANE